MCLVIGGKSHLCLLLQLLLSVSNVKENKSKKELKSLPLTSEKQSKLAAENETVIFSL